MLPLSAAVSLLVDFTFLKNQEKTTSLWWVLWPVVLLSRWSSHTSQAATCRCNQQTDELKCLRARQRKRGTCHCGSACFLTATHRCSAVAMDTVPFPPPPPASGYGGMGLERRGGPGYTAPASSSYQCSLELPPSPFPLLSPPLFSLIL